MYSESHVGMFVYFREIISHTSTVPRTKDLNRYKNIKKTLYNSLCMRKVTMLTKMPTLLLSITFSAKTYLLLR